MPNYARFKNISINHADTLAQRQVVDLSKDISIGKNLKVSENILVNNDISVGNNINIDNDISIGHHLIINDTNKEAYDGNSTIHAYNTTKETIVNLINNIKSSVLMNYVALNVIIPLETINSVLISNLLKQYTDFQEQYIMLSIKNDKSVELLYNPVTNDFSQYHKSLEFKKVSDSVYNEFANFPSNDKQNILLTGLFPVILNNKLKCSYYNSFLNNDNIIVLISISDIGDLLVEKIDTLNVVKMIKVMNNNIQIANSYNVYKTTNSYDDNFKNYLKLIRGNLLYKELYNNEYLFAYQLIPQDNSTDIYKNIIIEPLSYLEGQIIDNVFIQNTDFKLDDVILKILNRYNADYKDVTELLTPIIYEWIGGLKVSFINIVEIEGNKYFFGCGTDIELNINKTLNTYGTLKGTGMLDYRDNLKSIFKVDTVQKDILLNAHVGINTYDPISLFDIRDSTISNYLDLLVKANERNNDINTLVRTFKSLGNENDIINYIKNLTQRNNSFYTFTRIIPTDIINSVNLYGYHYEEYENFTLKDIITDLREKNDTLSLTMFSNSINNLNQSLIFDGAVYNNYNVNRYGYSDTNGKFFYMNNNFYLITHKLNVQEDIKSININNNWTDLFNRWSFILPYSMILYSQIKNIKDVYNFTTSYIKFNTYRNLLKYNKPDYFIKFYLFKINKFDINNSIIKRITIENDDYPIEFFSDIDFNRKLMFIELHSKILEKINDYNFNDADMNVYHCQDQTSDYNITTINVNNDNIYYDLLISITNIQSILPPTFSMTGDMNVKGDIVASKSDGSVNFFNVDPDDEFVGIGSDERYITYDNKYTSTTKTHFPKINTLIHSENYPNLVCERAANEIDNEDRRFGTLSSATMKRQSKYYSFRELLQKANEYSKQYGVDISFEIRDKDNQVQEIGNVGMSIESIDENTGRIKGAFNVYSMEKDENELVYHKQLLNVSNDSELSCNKVSCNTINLGGYLLEAKEDGLYYNGMKISA